MSQWRSNNIHEDIVRIDHRPTQETVMRLFGHKNLIRKIENALLRQVCDPNEWNGACRAGGFLAWCCAVGNELTKLLCARPNPPRRQRRQLGGVRRDGLRVPGLPVLRRGLALGLESGQLLRFPAGAAFLQDAGEQVGAGFARRVPGASVGGERAFDRRLQQRLAIARELFLRRFQFGHAEIQIVQQFFEFFDDA